MKISDYPHCTCTPDQQDGETPMCEYCFIQGARSAGIPVSVIEGRTKLSDHFSESYIVSQCSKETQDRYAEKKATADNDEPGTAYEPDIDICTACGEHAEFTHEYGSNCCNAKPVDTDPPDYFEDR